MKVASHCLLNLLVIDCRRATMKEEQRLNLHHHLEEVTSMSSKTRRRKPRGMQQARHPLFVTAAGRKATELLTVGIQKHVHFVERKAIMWLLFGRRNPCARSHIPFTGTMTRRLI